MDEGDDTYDVEKLSRKPKSELSVSSTWKEIGGVMTKNKGKDRQEIVIDSALFILM